MREYEERKTYMMSSGRFITSNTCVRQSTSGLISERTFLRSKWKNESDDAMSVGVTGSCKQTQVMRPPSLDTHLKEIEIE